MPTRTRWQFSALEAQQARELLSIYQRDLGVAATALVSELSRSAIPAEYWSEMEGVAAQLGVPLDSVLCGNLYYDALKVALMGCTAFAVDTPIGPLHARNLDWWTDNDALRRFTRQSEFSGSRAGDFVTVGWPGFVGVFSGVAPGRFAVTLNAVISDESPPQLGMPVVFALRRVLEEASNFEAALESLVNIPLASDSLLLLTGVRQGEMAVVERTPSRAEVRYGENGSIFVTNDYKLIRTGLSGFASELQATACGRYRRAEQLVTARRPQTADECFACLNDDGVRMRITAQQMVLQAATGLCVSR